MYKFIFNFFYHAYKRKGESTYRGSAALVVGITIFIHIVFISCLLEIATGINVLKIKLGNEDIPSNIISVPAIIIDIIAVLCFFSEKRAEKIVNQFPDNYKLATFKNVASLIILIAIPLTCIYFTFNYVNTHEPIFKIFH